MDVRTHFKSDTYQYTVNQRCIRFLFGMASRHNIIVHTWYKNAIGNANTPMGSNIAYFNVVLN